MVDRNNGFQSRINAAMEHLDQRAEGSQCTEMVAEMLAAADRILLDGLSKMCDPDGTIWVKLDTLNGWLGN